MVNIILIAAPAAGKGTEAAKIKNEFNVPHISTGDLLRDARKNDDEKSRIIAKCQDEGSMVPFDIVMELLKERIMMPDCDNGYILDGFPRDVNQAKAYDDILKDTNRKLGIVIVIDMDKEIAIKRIEGRLSCPNCKTVYNVNTEGMIPKTYGICDKCDEKLIKRPDDTRETYIERYKSYIDKTEPLINYYSNKGSNIVYHVDGNGTPDDTHSQVLEIIGENND